MDKEKLPQGEQDSIKSREMVLQWLNSYFDGDATKDSMRAIEINGSIYVIHIEKFVPIEEQIQQWKAITGMG